MRVTQLLSRGRFGTSTEYSDLVTRHLSAAHGRSSCTMRSAEAAPYASSSTVLGLAEDLEALQRRLSWVEQNLFDSTPPPVGSVAAELSIAPIGMKG